VTTPPPQVPPESLDVPAPASTEPRASFVAVSGAAAPGRAETFDPQRSERRAIERRLRDAAVHAVIEASPVVLVLALVVWTSAVLAAPAGASRTFWAVCTLAAVAAWAAIPWVLRRRARVAGDTRGLRRAYRWMGVHALAWLALAPWLPGLAWQPHRELLTLLLAGLSLVAVASLAPLRVQAGVAAALPLSPALALWTEEAQFWPRPAVVGLLLVALAAAALSLLRRRAWRNMARALIERDDRIRAVEAERDQAIRADQEKSRFLAIASHDLRQPVHALGLFAATLEKRLQGSPEEPVVRNVMRSIDGLDRSFNAMLDVSRLDAGTIEPNIQHFPLRDLFRRLHMHFAGQAELAGLGLRFSPGGKSVSSDPQLLERILGNLIQNAIKYTREGGIVVVARTTTTHINVEVWDTGVGIGAADLSKVFDEFYQIGRGERSRAQGLGMGLAIVKRLARLLGHGLTVASQPGRGTMFRVAIALGGLAEMQNVTAAADTVPLPALQPRTVLVIDDEEPIREGLSILLHEWGYQAVTASSLEEAEAAVRAMDLAPDLVLSDLHLGQGPDGIAAVEAVRRHCGYAVPAVLITGDTTHEEMRRATDSGHPVLFKPVQPRKLLNVLRGLVS
jgi:signal transduction histidine kinase